MSEDLKQYIEGGEGIFVIRGGEFCRGWNGIRYKPGLSGKNTPTTKLSMNVATIHAVGRRRLIESEPEPNGCALPARRPRAVARTGRSSRAPRAHLRQSRCPYREGDHRAAWSASVAIPPRDFDAPAD